MGLTGRRTLRATVVAGAVAVLAIGVAAVAGLGIADAKLRPGLNRIVGGDQVAQDELPFMAHLTISVGGQSFGCGGSLIREDVVLTAAHCLAGVGVENGDTEAVEVLLGATALDDQDAEVIKSTAVFSDPDFVAKSDGSLHNDWAVVKLAKASEKGQTVEFVGQGDTAGQEGKFTVAGWGATAEGGRGSNEMLKVDLDFFDDDTCVEKNTEFTELDPAIMLCAGTAEGGLDSCQGDSGGPLFKVVDGQVVQHGVVSFGTGCARADLPGPYTELAAFSDEIAQAADTIAAGEGAGDQAGEDADADNGDAAGDEGDAADDAAADGDATDSADETDEAADGENGVGAGVGADPGGTADEQDDEADAGQDDTEEASEAVF